MEPPPAPAPAVVTDQLGGIELARPMIGWPGSTRFVVRPLGPAFEPYAAMSSLDQPGLDFVVVPPGALFDDYVIEIPAADVETLALGSPEDTAVLVLVTGRGYPVPTVNLMGPLVVNRRSMRGLQVVLDASGYGSAVPVSARTARPDRSPGPLARTARPA
jgi:flagellar assembly factor FliW